MSSILHLYWKCFLPINSYLSITVLFGEKFFRYMSVRANVIRGTVRQGNVRLGNCPSGNYPLGNCPSGKCLRGTVRRGNVRRGKVCRGIVCQRTVRILKNLWCGPLSARCASLLNYNFTAKIFCLQFLISTIPLNNYPCTMNEVFH